MLSEARDWCHLTRLPWNFPPSSLGLGQVLLRSGCPEAAPRRLWLSAPPWVLQWVGSLPPQCSGGGVDSPVCLGFFFFFNDLFHVSEMQSDREGKEGQETA